MAKASFARVMRAPISAALDALDAALAIGGLEAPEDVPGVDDGLDGAVMAG